jgi:ferredoxin/flavodoxin---NADP+ reductase
VSGSLHRAAVVGAGPAGFYATEQLLRAGIEVDLFDALPTPFGLVRAGVAPDHPKIKSVTRIYEATAAHPAFRFFGGVELGPDLSREDLLERYHAVLYAVGTAADKKLGIVGEDRAGSVAATEFVSWYNGHPEFADHEFDLSCERAVVVGNGNVAIDVARMLALDPDELALTDAADHAIECLARARVRDVVILGRRGPAQAAFTNPELRELGELKRADVIVDPTELDEVEVSDDMPPAVRRNVDLLRTYSRRDPAGKSHRIALRFLRSPVEVLGTERVTGLRVAKNRLGAGQRAIPTGAQEVIQCGLVVRSIGYRGRPLPGLPFDASSGLIRNDGGRVTGEDGKPLRGEYVVGWIKRGPSGVIGTNKKDAAETTANLLADARADRLNEPTADTDREAIEAWLRTRVAGLVTWAGWRAIDEHEVHKGQQLGRPRIKVVRRTELLSIAATQGDATWLKSVGTPA